MNSGIKADYTRTCEGCRFAGAEKWGKDRTFWRCEAEGPRKGRVIGIDRFLPYVPAWCPISKNEGENGQ